jgi:hypothetical protein
MCHQGEVVRERDRSDQQIALSDRLATEDVANPCVVFRCATIERDNFGSPHESWTSTRDFSNGANAWLVAFGNGTTLVLSKTGGARARAVRGGF